MSKKQLIRLTENDLYNIINESVKTLIIESQESKSQSEAIKYLMQKMNWDKERANNFVRNDLRQDITALRDKNIAKFTLGVTRMYCDRQLSNARILSNLNATLKLLSAHLNEYDRNLNGLSAQELIDRFAQTRQDNVNAEKGEIDSMDFSQGSKYQIVPINSFEEAQDYYEYTNPNSRWCLTYMDGMFDSYTCNGINQIYFCLHEGFESEPCEVGENAPLDDYGLSMLSIIVNENGELVYCTTRWNHDNGGSDSSMSAKEVSQVVGVNFYQVFKPNNKWQTILSDVKEKMSRGVPYDRIFDWIGNFNDGFAQVGLNDKYNFINTNGEFISDQWFDDASNFRNGFAWVGLNDKYNFINTNGDFISDQWFDDIDNFNDGYAQVGLNDKYNFINTNVEFISDQWFDDIDNFKNGYAVVSLNDKWNFINTNGDFISDQWFDSVGDFNDGYAVVGLNGKGNFINTNVEFISDQWFDVVSSFNNGYARVRLNDKWNFINTNGDFISDQWFDAVGNFKNGYAKVKLNGKDYKFNPKDGKLYNITENKQYNNMAKKQLIKLTEGSLRKIIKECINSVLNENYSARHYSNQISDITKKFLSFKDMVDRLGGYYRTWEGYGIKISLKPFFDKKSNIQPKYRRDKEYYIRINYDYQKSGNVVTGFYNPNKLHKTDFQIELTVPSQAQYNDIFYSIEHEVTHLIDDLIKESKGLHAHSFPTIQMENASLPKYARMLLYILWTNTEFNAWQANFRQMCGDKDFLEVMIKYLNDANNSYDENEWLNIQSFVSNKIKDNRLQQIRPFAFKNYFIKNSFKLLKKMVKKYY